MKCENLEIKRCFNCDRIWGPNGIMKNLDLTLPEQGFSHEEAMELACWVNVYHRSIDMRISDGDEISTAIGNQLLLIKGHPIGEPDFPEVYWLRVCVKKYYPEYVDTLEKLLLLT